MSKQIVKNKFGIDAVKVLTPFEKLNQAFQSEFYRYSKHLEGRLLTIIDASFPDRDQREAVKSLVRQACWDKGFAISGILEQFTNKYQGQVIVKFERHTWENSVLPEQDYFSVIQ